MSIDYNKVKIIHQLGNIVYLILNSEDEATKDRILRKIKIMQFNMEFELNEEEKEYFDQLEK